MKEEGLRCFVAVGLSEAVREQCVRVRTDLPSVDRALRWVRAESLHLTLKFLGDVPAGAVQALEAALADVAAGSPAFDLAFRGLGTFGARRAPRVLWVGVEDGSGRCRALQKRIEDACARQGFPRERRPYAPHLTLARIRGPLRDHAWLDAVGGLRARELGRQAVTGFALMRSELLAGGARYTALAEFPLAGATCPSS